jgi:hypothetical protein
MPCRVIHVQSLAPVLPRGPVTVTYGPSLAFSLSELDWINQVLFPASVTVLHHIPGHANQKKKFQFTCSLALLVRSLYYQHCATATTGVATSTVVRSGIVSCALPPLLAKRKPLVSRAHQPRHVEVAIAAHTCSRRRRPASHAAYAHRTGHAGRMCLRSRTARAPLSPSALAHASRRVPPTEPSMTYRAPPPPRIKNHRSLTGSRGDLACTASQTAIARGTCPPRS